MLDRNPTETPAPPSRSVRRTQLGAAMLLACALFACSKLRGTDKGDATAQPTTAPAPLAAAPNAPAATGPSVPFVGTFTKYAEVTFDKNHRPIHTSNSNGKGTLTVDPGRVSYAQVYPYRGKQEHVTQFYSFTDADVHPVTGGFDVSLTFVRMDSDSTTYSPDRNAVKIQARKQTAGWQIGFNSTDNNGVTGGAEFR